MRVLSALILAALVVFAPVAVQAQQVPRQAAPCVPHEVAVEQLTTVFKEEVIGLGLGKNQQTVVELYVGGSGSWTILVTLTNGMSCIAASGQNWTGAEQTARRES